jgi:hypothetical protein
MRVPWENMEDFRTFSFRGLSQGDLPSPLLFDIVGDVLGAMISGAISRCHLSGVGTASNRGSDHSYAYAYRDISGIPWHVNSNHEIYAVVYEAMSGLKIILRKIQFFGVDQVLY